MGFLDDAKDTAAAATKKIGGAVEDGVDRAKHKLDEVEAEAEVKKAGTERDATKAKNAAKEELRND